MGALRTVTVWLLMLAASGVIPVASTCIESPDGCGDVCKRCSCKQARPGENFRARCACCELPPGTQAVTLIPPAIMPSAAPTLCPPARGQTLTALTGHAGPFAPPVPDPPPRARLLF